MNKSNGHDHINHCLSRTDQYTHRSFLSHVQVLGWRSPNLKPAGDAQPEVLKRFGYTYDISLTYTRHNSNDDIPWPYTLDYGYPYSCSVPPCPGSHSSHPGFWEIPVHSLYNPQSGYPCAYVDSCRPTDEASAFEYLWSNFQKVGIEGLDLTPVTDCHPPSSPTSTPTPPSLLLPF